MVRTASIVWWLAAAGCVRVAPYQRGQLAQPVMQQVVAPAIEAEDTHVAEVREGTGGATGTTGGGCGCN